jgi:hypothetical protein
MDKVKESYQLIEDIKDNISLEEYETLISCLKEYEECVSNELKKLENKDFLTIWKNYKHVMIGRAKVGVCNCSPTEICAASSLVKLRKCKNFSSFLLKNSIIRVLYNMTIEIDLKIKLKIITNKQELEFVRMNIMNLINLSQVCGKEANSNIFAIALIHFVLENLYALLIDKTLAKSICRLFDEYCTKVEFLEILGKFGFNPVSIRQDIALFVRE